VEVSASIRFIGVIWIFNSEEADNRVCELRTTYTSVVVSGYDLIHASSEQHVFARYFVCDVAKIECGTCGIDGLHEPLQELAELIPVV
jgi:hypothetical protein